jgi:hypothetical protein
MIGMSRGSYSVWNRKGGKVLRFIVGLFLVLYGLVHLLYFAQSRRLFALQAGLVWPDGSWAFSKLLGEDGARKLASLACALAAIGFVGSGVGVFAGQGWWRPVVVGAALFSAVVFVLFWDGALPPRCLDCTTLPSVSLGMTAVRSLPFLSRGCSG